MIRQKHALAGFALGILLAASAGGEAGAVAPRRVTCSAATDLGVSRIIEIDTSAGVAFGNQYESASSLLKDREVALTFDDGPSPATTTSILDTLDRFCTKAVFFSVGRMALAYPDTLRDVARRGHTIGGHTWSHPFLHRLSQDKAELEVEKGLSTVAAMVGKPIAPFFRFPYLDDPKAMVAYVKGRGIGIFGIDVDSRDTRGYGPARITSYTLDSLKKLGHGIVLFHDIKSNTAKALPDVLAGLKREGFRIVLLVPKKPLETKPAIDQALALYLEQRKAKRAAVADKKAGSAGGGATVEKAAYTVDNVFAGGSSDKPSRAKKGGRKAVSPTSHRKKSERRSRRKSASASGQTSSRKRR
ncbi:MAG: polysaccharide deacetylase family protein [Hyphomicrobiaceae bacterium]